MHFFPERVGRSFSLPSPAYCITPPCAQWLPSPYTTLNESTRVLFPFMLYGMGFQHTKARLSTCLYCFREI